MGKKKREKRIKSWDIKMYRATSGVGFTQDQNDAITIEAINIVEMCINSGSFPDAQIGGMIPSDFNISGVTKTTIMLIVLTLRLFIMTRYSIVTLADVKEYTED